MADKKANRIPIRYPDSEEESEISNRSHPDDFAESQAEQEDIDEASSDLCAAADEASDSLPIEADAAWTPPTQKTTGELGGPLTAELVATRAELKRVEGERDELKDRLARRQADFENYRKRVERQRSETYERVVAEIAGKLLP